MTVARPGRSSQRSGLRGRLAWFAVLLVGGAQGLALFALHPDLSVSGLLRAVTASEDPTRPVDRDAPGEVGVLAEAFTRGERAAGSRTIERGSVTLAEVARRLGGAVRRYRV